MDLQSSHTSLNIADDDDLDNLIKDLSLTLDTRVPVNDRYVYGRKVDKKRISVTP